MESTNLGKAFPAGAGDAGVTTGEASTRRPDGLLIPDKTTNMASSVIEPAPVADRERCGGLSSDRIDGWTLAAKPVASKIANVQKGPAVRGLRAETSLIQWLRFNWVRARMPM
jgi:hypothetical protein